MLVHLRFDLLQLAGQGCGGQAQQFLPVSEGLLGDLPALGFGPGRHTASAFHDVLDALGHTPGRDAVSGVEGLLPAAAPLRFLYGPAHGTGHLIGVENGAAVEVARGAADGLNERAVRAQKAFFVGVQDGDQGDLGHVQALAQQVNAHQHIEMPQAQIADNLHALDRIDVGVQIAHAHVVLGQILGEVLRHALGQGGHQHALPGLHGAADFAQQIIDLGAGGPHFELGVHQPGGSRKLLDDLARVLPLVGSGRRRHEHGLRQHLLPLGKFERPVIQRRGQAKAVLH